MLNFILTAISAILCVELFIRFLPRAVGQFFAVLTRILYVIGNASFSDHWKEKVLLVYAARLFKYTMLLLLVLWFCFLPFIVLLIIPQLNIDEFLYSFVGIIFSTAIAACYAIIRSKVLNKNNETQKSDYSETSRILHRLVLGNRIVPVLLFYKERFLFFRKKKKAVKNPIFVCGLARAGTTLLMREIYATNQFISLTYADMPFVTSPNIWRIMSAGRRKKEMGKERAHGDGVVVKTNSPEALEEVFWKNFCASTYLYSNALRPHKVNRKILNYFKQYVGLIAGSKRYLSKNNNNILRIDSLKQAFPQATIIVPFREPLSHAHSLMTQHRRFVDMCQQDSFVKEYMLFLAHHEFGATQRPFDFGVKQTFTNREDVNYWLELWVNTYEYIVNNFADSVIFAAYEEVCDADSKTWEVISQHAGYKLPIKAASLRKAEPTDVTGYDSQLLSKARYIYEILLKNC